MDQQIPMVDRKAAKQIGIGASQISNTVLWAMQKAKLTRKEYVEAPLTIKADKAEEVEGPH